jgi:3-hydroxybutyryl-CoA dehydratase
MQAGDFVEHSFSFTDEDMAAFARLSGDNSAVHRDAEFARSRGFRDVIVYGGLMLSQLSFVVGSKLPGDRGVSTRWSIDYRAPLYVGEIAVLRLEVVNVSEATGLIDGKFTIRCEGRTLAKGVTQSLLPVADLQA